jgi:hypothetical protein
MAAATDLTFPPADVPLLSGSEPGSFAYDTISRRLPGILDGVIADLQQLPGSHQSADQQQLPDQVAAAAQAVEQLRDEMRGKHGNCHPLKNGKKGSQKGKKGQKERRIRSENKPLALTPAAQCVPLVGNWPQHLQHFCGSSSYEMQTEPCQHRVNPMQSQNHLKHLQQQKR